MTDTLRDRIAAEDEKHCQVLMVNSGGWACRCGTRFPSDLDAYRKWRLHKADAILAIPGIAAVELPELMVNREEVPQSIRHQSMWEQKYAWATIQDDDGLIYFENGSDGVAYGTVNPAEARDLAAALLAAADYAERDQ